jgi:hypothetical protein
LGTSHIGFFHGDRPRSHLHAGGDE